RSPDSTLAATARTECILSTRSRPCPQEPGLRHALSCESAPAPPSRIQYFLPCRNTPRSALVPKPSSSRREILPTSLLCPTSCMYSPVRPAPSLSTSAHKPSRLHGGRSAHAA